MEIIDAHCHTSFWTRPDFKEFESVNKSIRFSKEGLLAEMKRNNVIHAITPTSNRKDKGLLEEEYFNNIKDRKISILAGLNPSTLNQEVLKRAEEHLIAKNIIGFKIYLGYYHYGIEYKGYHPFYRLAQKYDVPILVHTGDTFHKNAKLKYSHPLTMDETAVDFPDTKFVIAHLGSPWTIDAAEVVYKNDNVFTDLSGFVLGSRFTPVDRKRIEDAYVYIENPDKLMYGTDWPLAPMKETINFMKAIIPKRDHKKFFYSNAKKVYKLKI